MYIYLAKSYLFYKQCPLNKMLFRQRLTRAKTYKTHFQTHIGSSIFDTNFPNKILTF